MITTSQLLEAGVQRDVASKWARSGRLHRIHRGVYAVGHTSLSRECRWMAAVLACGEGAVLSHRSAAALWGLLDPPEGPIEVSVPLAGGRKPRTGIRIYRRPGLAPTSITCRRNIPVTRPAQTIDDLKRCVSAARLRFAIRQAEIQGLPTGLDGCTEATRSELEEIFLSLCRAHRIPSPEINVRIAGLEVDFLWPGQRLVVETDGYRFHRGSFAFENDHDRDLRLRTAGYDVVRLTYRHVTTEPDRVASLVHRELGKSE